MTEKDIRAYLKTDMPVFVYDVTDSTNTRAKEYAKTNDVKRALFVAKEQTSGRGRQGKSFYSPRDTGVYMSYLFSVKSELADAVSITTAASVAVLTAIESLCEKKVSVKWVNDLYLDDKKICGILTEAIMKEGRLSHIVIGVGINITTKLFPDDISDIAGSLETNISPAALVGAVADNLAHLDVTDKGYLKLYKERLFILGREITYCENGVPHTATAVDVDENGGLVIRDTDGIKTLTSGEISVRFKNSEA